MAETILRPVSAGRRTQRKLARRADSVPRSTVALLAMSILVPLVLFGLAATQNRRDVERAAVRRVERTVRILHEQALKVFETQQLMIDQLNDRLRGFDWSNPTAVADLHNMLGHLQALLPQITTIAITDADGHVRVSSRTPPAGPAIDVSDRDYFVELEAHDQAMPYISRGTIGRQSHEPVFHIAQRLQGQIPGRFNGVIVIAIDQTYFTEFYRENEHDRDHVIVLAHEDGSVLASEPPMDNARLPTATMFRLELEGRARNLLVRPALIDGAKRIMAYERCGNYPIVVGFGISWRSALAPWWHNMWAYGLVALLSSVVLLAVSGFAIRRIALEGAATVRWRRSAAQLADEIAERGKVEEQLRQSQKMEAVGRLTGGIAHDFNNLLTVVIGSLDLLSRRMKDAEPRQKMLINNAVDGATRAAALTSRLLAFSRQHPLDPETLDANVLIRGMSNLLQRTLAETVSIEWAFADELWSTFIDQNQLENAILNLCVNAVDAMPKGGQLTLATANVTLDEAYCARHAEMIAGEFVMIAVTDTGTGMPPDVVARAFEPFFTTKPVGKGTGLGLSQVYGFARQSRGHAAIHSVLDQGTTIKLYLPRKVAEPAAEAAPSVPEPEVVPARRPAKILIVEDDEMVRDFSTTALRDAGYTIVEAATGPEGLAMLRQHPDVELLFTDLVLKGPLNGRELAEQIGLVRPDLPVLFTTGYTKDAIVADGSPDDGVSFIGKPFTTAALTVKIAGLLFAEAPEVRRSAAE